MEQDTLIQVPAKETVDLAAVDSVLFGRTFFPKTFRQESPEFHREVFADLENQQARFVGLEIFRDGAKTTLLRCFTAKRISYGVSRTIEYVSASQDHSIRSVRWLKKQIDHNKRWTQTFHLERGSKWTDEIIEIYHAVCDFTVTVIALGITGQIRGVNIDDYRPDLIVVDDPSNEENTGTPEQREKQKKLFFGSLEKSLTPASENPSAKMVLLATPLNKEDLISSVHGYTGWLTKKFSVFDEAGESRWPSRYSTELLRRDKQNHLDRGQLLLWLSEKECSITDEANCFFKAEWLRYYEEEPKRMVVIGAVDPVPPPKDGRPQSLDTDSEVMSIWGYSKGNVYLLEEVVMRGHQPDRTVTEFFRLNDRWHPLKWRVETIAYQRTLVWILRRAMEERRRFVQIDEIEDKRKKAHRIVQGLSGISSSGHLFVRKSHATFIEQFLSYPNVKHDDSVDAAASAVEGLINDPLMMEMLATMDLESGEMEAVPKGFRGAP